MSSRVLRRSLYLLAMAFACVMLLLQLGHVQLLQYGSWRKGGQDTKIQWGQITPTHASGDLRHLHMGSSDAIPKIQFTPGKEAPEAKAERLKRRAAVERVFSRSWNAYKKHAWLKDEVKPLTGGFKNGYGGMGATLVDSLDTLWIMGKERDFATAVAALKGIDFTRPHIDEVNVFETTIRYLGGLLAAHDLCNGTYPLLAAKAVELGDMLYAAFDTPNRLPVTRWYWADYLHGDSQQASRNTVASEIGSLTLEFTRLSQLTGDPRYFDAVERITDELEEHQNRTKIPGLWPSHLNAKEADFTDDHLFTMGGMADSLYEYLVKQHILLQGGVKRYRMLYLTAIRAAKEHLFFKPLLPDPQEILLSCSAKAFRHGHVQLDPQAQHLACFLGGMLAVGSKVFNHPEDMETARQLTDGCIWAYRSMPSGIMPEVFSITTCEDGECLWDENTWHREVAWNHRSEGVEDGPKIAERLQLSPGWTKIQDARYLLRPEAIESIFVMYRTTGDSVWQDKAWEMFQAIERATRTNFGYASLVDVTARAPEHLDSCESFWTAETLKYFYLIFSEPDHISLDKYVFNTEAHPLKRLSDDE